MRNRLFNCKNPYQGSARKVLCVCSAGLLRSPTLAVILNREYGYNTRSVGTDTGHALIPIDKVHVAWAEEILVMDYSQARRVKEIQDETLYEEPADIFILDIPDEYGYMDEALQSALLSEYRKVISGENVPYID